MLQSSLLINQVSEAIGESESCDPASSEPVLPDQPACADTEGFADLIRPHQTKVYRRCLAILKNHADAEEAAQDTFLKAFRRLDQYRGDAQFGTWLVAIAHNECFGRLRKYGYTHYTSLDSSDMARPVAMRLRATSPTPEQQYGQKQTATLLQNATDALPEIYRIVFSMRDLWEMDTAETAAALGISSQAVKTRLSRARAMLRKWLERRRIASSRQHMTGAPLDLGVERRRATCRANALHENRRGLVPAPARA